MKKVVFSLIVLSFTAGIYGQALRVSIAPTLSNACYFPTVVGGYGSDGKLGVAASIEYIKSYSTRLSYGFGIDFQHSNLEIIPAPTGEPIESHHETINVLSASFKTVYNLRKVYFTANPLLNFQLPSESQRSVDKQTGLGLSFSVGRRFEITEHIGCSIEPIIWIHNVIPFIDQGIPERLIVLGIKAGISIE